LSGPLGQGATLIELTDTTVVIDRGDGKVHKSTEPEAFINQQLGAFVPIRSLRYWVIGLADPTQPATKIPNGFKQGDWLVEYKQQQSTENDALPRKITVMNTQVKLKLIIDQWTLNQKP
jgi:outer membrane lipoprotein LolB